MFIIDIEPVIISFGPIGIRWYSLFYIIGFLMLYYWLIYLGKKKELKMDREEAERFVTYSILGIIIGARIFYFIFYEPGTLINDPLEFFKIWHGGMSFHGGLIGFIAGAYLFSRKEFLSILDASAVVAALALALGRLGNLINGELVGVPFNGPWCTVFLRFDEVCRHPYQIYALISHLILFVFLLQIYKKREMIGRGIITVSFVIGYGVLRFITDIWKLDDHFWILKNGQWLSIAMIIGGILIIAKFLNKK